MKKLAIITILSILIIACAGSVGHSNPQPKESSIKVIYDETINGWTIRVVEIDKHQYVLLPSVGGILHHEACPCLY